MHRSFPAAALLLGATSAGAFVTASDAEPKAFMAFLINRNGDLCAEVKSAPSTPGATSTVSAAPKYRAGSGRVSCRLNARTGVARQNGRRRGHWSAPAQ
ncbi:hypothetical protein JF540_09205 [Salipiger thiooxidans]|uniref:hypothetical protein n=1 Tax=Salipiger thiooxidans TaxID=282683 RepID=UPI001A904553|nr:hypothetical protein [Salipiger thiooxidans]MBN8186865.1 hypothetical protein [Salipiger thiooxidans]